LGYASATALAAAAAGFATSTRAPAAIGAEKKDGIVKLQALGEPVGWNGYLNGQVPLAAMTAITVPNSTPFAYPKSLPQIYMRPDAAIDLANWMNAYATKFDTYLKLNEGYRTLDGQRYWKDQEAAGGNEAATVGRSNHGLGQAIDFERSYIPEGSAKLQWLRDTAATYGFARYAGERWHFDYIRAYAPTTSPADTDWKDSDMIVIANSDTNQWVAAEQGRWDAIPSGQGDLFIALSGRARVVLNDRDFLIARDYFTTGKQTDTKVYANTSTNAWYVVGPGVFYQIPSGQQTVFTNAFGPRVAIDNNTFLALQAAFLR
jgi:hypothetical protein